MKFKVTKVEQLRGAGDAIALVAEPIKRLIQAVHPRWDCGGCQKRREDWNRRLPFRR